MEWAHHSVFKIKKNYPPKGRWIVVDIYLDVKWQGIYLAALWTDTERVSCFSIYQISWIKIKKELFINKKRHLGTVCLYFNWQCFGDHFYTFVANSVRKFFYRPVNINNPNLSLSWYFLVQLIHFPLKF